MPCRRSPGCRRCRGEIVAELDHASGYIVWQRPLCGDNGTIDGWEDTLWNRHGGVPPTLSDGSPKARH
jgi:hypothetical protein